MKEKFLPIGTVCTLRGINKKIMISGFFGISYRGKLKMYDYTGVEYPEGLLLQNRTYSFNHTDIEKIEFIGYEAEEHKILSNNLLNNNVSDKPVEKTNLMSNFKFDENGVVIFDGTVEEQKEEPKIENKVNPFNQIYMKQEQKEEKPKEFSQFKFDKNGVVIADETESSNGFKFDKNGVVIADETITNKETSEFKFDENGVVIEDGTQETLQNIETSEFKFDENGVVVSDGSSVDEMPIVIE